MKHLAPFLFIALVALSCGGTSSNSSTNNETASEVDTSTIELSIKLDFEGLSETRTFTAMSIKKGVSVYEALNLLKKSDSTFNFELKDYPQLGRLVIGFDGISSQDNKYWVYCLNGDLASKGIDSQKIEESGTLKWILTDKKDPCD